MSIQYPHKLLFIAAGEPYQDGNGNWVNPSQSDSWQDASPFDTDCREEPEDGGKSTVVVDGVNVEFTSMVYAMSAVANLKRGDRVRITYNGSIKLETTVKRFSREHFHCLIWV